MKRVFWRRGRQLRRDLAGAWKPTLIASYDAHIPVAHTLVDLLYLTCMTCSIRVEDKPRFRICRSTAGSEACLYVISKKRTLALAYPSLMVIFRTNSFLNRTVCTPEMAFTTVDFPCATCPIVPVPGT